MMLRVRTPYADGIADPDLGQAPELPDLTRAHGRAADAGTLVEDADGGHLALAVLRDPQPVSRSHRAGEHPDVRDLLAGGTALDLEDAARDRAVGIAFPRGQQLGDAGSERIDTRSGDRRAEEHGMNQAPLGLSHELLSQPLGRNARLVLDVSRQQCLVPFGERRGEP